MMISLFKNIKHTTAAENIEFLAFYDGVKHGKWEDVIHAVRIEKDKERRKILKEMLPYVTVSGTFSKRENDGLISHSGLICIDFDDVDDLERSIKTIQNDAFSFSVMLSASGTGFAAMVKIDAKRHNDSFEALQAYYFNKYSLIVDARCKDVARARYVTYDPNAFINPESHQFIAPAKSRPAPKAPNVFFAEDDIQLILGQIISQKIDITGDYGQWLQIGFAIESKYGDSGRDLFHQVSQFHPKYSERICDKQYENCLKSKGNGITISTFFYFAKQAGLQIITDKTKQIATAAKQAKKAKKSPDDAVTILKDIRGIDPKDSRPIVEQVFQSASELKDDNQLSLVEQMELFLSSNYSFRRNSITRYIECGGVDIDTKFLNSIYLQAKRAVSDKVNYELTERLINSDFTPDYNPLVKFFEDNQELCPTGLIDKLAETINSDTGLAEDCFFPQYVSHFVKKWLVGIVSAAHGIHSPLVLVLTGGQGTGKTEWFRRLLPDELKKYYAESKLDAGKDDEILMTQKLIIMDDEMGGKSKKESKRLKELTSKQVFSLREPYGKNNVDLHRMAVLCGTTNDNQILSDPTGNRRVIPINVLSIDHVAYNKIDKTDLLMEAYHLWKSGWEWQLSKDDIAKLTENTTEFEEVNVERELIIQYFRIPNALPGTVENMTVSAIKAHLENMTRQSLNKSRIKIAMEKLGFAYKRIKIGFETVSWGFQVVKL